ncbi:hypothetical protein G7085_16025 [Tessaracoccus sp. HDW20]|uniref:hypothetical protein n=1 Tax=Tessaracoccus coleopterorum TaxID=2714950 RepID=UPI0018D4013C|nr:hypothetical protein [Tessaracoccus coleopterorum]NHB85596.1 hypothetical protein [Tessaracoccus coleopterorum]
MANASAPWNSPLATRCVMRARRGPHPCRPTTGWGDLCDAHRASPPRITTATKASALLTAYLTRDVGVARISDDRPASSSAVTHAAPMPATPR